MQAKISRLASDTMLDVTVCNLRQTDKQTGRERQRETEIITGSGNGRGRSKGRPSMKADEGKEQADSISGVFAHASVDHSPL